MNNKYEIMANDTANLKFSQREIVIPGQGTKIGTVLDPDQNIVEYGQEVLLKNSQNVILLRDYENSSNKRCQSMLISTTYDKEFMTYLRETYFPENKFNRNIFGLFRAHNSQHWKYDYKTAKSQVLKSLKAFDSEYVKNNRDKKLPKSITKDGYTWDFMGSTLGEKYDEIQRVLKASEKWPKDVKFVEGEVLGRKFDHYLIFPNKFVGYHENWVVVYEISTGLLMVADDKFQKDHDNKNIKRFFFSYLLTDNPQQRIITYEHAYGHYSDSTFDWRTFTRMPAEEVIDLAWYVIDQEKAKEAL